MHKNEWGHSMYFLQIESQPTLISLLITAITALSGVIIFLFMYNKSLNKEIRMMANEFSQKLQEVYKEQIKDSKEVIQKNTEAFIKHTEAVENSAEISKELRDTIQANTSFHSMELQEFKLWLKENYGKRG